MRNIEIGGYIRISKKEVEKRYNAGEIIRLCACKVSPVNVCGAFMLIVRKKNFPILGMMVLIPLFPVIENLKR